MNIHARIDALHDTRQLIAHVVFRFDVGGLENGVVNLINRPPEESYQHAVLSLTEITDFRARVASDDVLYFALGKKPRQGFWLYPKLLRLFRNLAPGIVHTRNLAALEASLPAWLSGVPVRVHPRQSVLERFSLDQMVRDYLSLYDGLLSRRRASPARAGANG